MKNISSEYNWPIDNSRPLTIEKAQGKRHCVCGAPILKGETHLAIKKENRFGRTDRINYCMACAIVKIQDNMDYWPKVLEVAKQYLKDHPDIKGRQILSSLYKKKGESKNE